MMRLQEHINFNNSTTALEKQTYSTVQYLDESSMRLSFPTDRRFRPRKRMKGVVPGDIDAA